MKQPPKKTPRKTHLLLGLLILVMFFVAKKLAFYLLFVGLTAYIIYYTKLFHFPFDISPLFFLQIVITRYYGLPWALLFILLGYVLPKVATGTGMHWESYAFVTVSIGCDALSLLMTAMHLQTVGYITSIIQYIGGIFIGMVAKPFIFAAADGIANVTNNLLYFLIFTDLILFLFG